MPDKYLYEYAVIRLVPKVEREEFINVGIILFCKKEHFIKVLYHLNTAKLHVLAEDCETENVEKHLVAFQQISRGTPEAGPIAEFDIASRFRWLTAVRSAVIQTSRPHPGLSSDLEKTAQKLFEALVL
jgi:hypothetical protein